jgi:hypothetical protein
MPAFYRHNCFIPVIVISKKRGNYCFSQDFKCLHLSIDYTAVKANTGFDSCEGENKLLTVQRRYLSNLFQLKLNFIMFQYAGFLFTLNLQSLKYVLISCT